MNSGAAVLLRDVSELGSLVGAPGETLQDALRRTLLEMILFGYFPRGTRLYPNELAERFDVSSTPVREALMRLAAEGYIEAVPRRGFHIREPSAKQIANLWHVRRGLEITAGELLIARLVSRELSDAAVDAVSAIQAEIDSAGPALTHKGHVELNARFHRTMVDLAGNALLTSLYDGIQMQLLGAWVQRGLTTWRPRLVDEGTEHLLLIDALRSRDGPQFTEVLRTHIDRSLAGALSDFQAQKRFGADA